MYVQVIDDHVEDSGETMELDAHIHRVGGQPGLARQAAPQEDHWDGDDLQRRAGGLMLNPGAGAPIETDLSMAMAARGGRGQILGGGGGGFGLAFKADALWVGMRTHAASGPSGNLESTRAGVSGCARRSKARRA